MAAPYVAGELALLLEARPDIPRTLAKTIFQNNAKPVLVPHDLKFAYPVSKQGAGMVNVYAAIKSTTVITPPVIALNDVRLSASLP